MRHVAFAAVLTLGLLASTGCKSGPVAATQPATQPAAAPSTTSSAAEEMLRRMVVKPLDAAAIGYASSWTTDISLPRNQRIRSVNVLEDVIVVIEEPEFMITAISARDGSVMWKKMLPTDVTETFEARRVDKTIYISSSTKLWGLSVTDGKLITLSNLAFSINNAPARYDSSIVEKTTYLMYGSAHGRVFAHDAATGYQRWVYRLPAGIIVSPILVNKNTIFSVDSKGEWVLLNAETGDALWRGRAAERVSAAPVTNNSRIFIASEDQNLYCIDRATGSDKWKFRSTGKLTAPPALFANSLFQRLHDGTLVSLDIANGKEFWRVPGGLTPVSLNDTKLITHDDKSITVLDNISGRELVRSPALPLKTVLGGPTNSLIVVGAQGRLQRLDK